MAYARRNVDNDALRRDTPSSEQKKGYKVVVESVLEEKKSLKSHISYSETAPNGYTFVPVGVPHLTEACKELARKRGLDIMIVSATPTRKSRLNAEHISHHIHRIGHHFPNKIVDDVHEQIYDHNTQGTMSTASLGRRLDAQGDRLGLTGRQATAAERSEQIAGAIKELFPRIPDDECAAIVQRAFETGAKTVGNAPLPLTRRVQLAVLAHIRHVHTDYDVLLKTFKWTLARQLVEEPCLKQIQKWRGETDQQDDEIAELEKVMREVIVIDDSDGEDNANSIPRRRALQRVPSLEVLGQRTVSTEHAGASMATPPIKRRRVSPPERRRSASPMPRGPQRTEIDIISVRPERGPRPRQVLQLDEMTRRAETWGTEHVPHTMPSRTMYPDQYRQSGVVYSRPPHSMQHAFDEYYQPGELRVEPPPPYYAPPQPSQAVVEGPYRLGVAPLPPSPYAGVYESAEHNKSEYRRNKRFWPDQY